MRQELITRMYSTIIKDLLKILKDTRKVETWVLTANPNFNGRSPKVMVQSGKGKEVMEFIKSNMMDK